jgi:hypothetical protein
VNEAQYCPVCSQPSLVCADEPTMRVCDRGHVFPAVAAQPIQNFLHILYEVMQQVKSANKEPTVSSVVADISLGVLVDDLWYSPEGKSHLRHVKGIASNKGIPSNDHVIITYRPLFPRGTDGQEAYTETTTLTAWRSWVEQEKAFLLMRDDRPVTEAERIENNKALLNTAGRRRQQLLEAVTMYLATNPYVRVWHAYSHMPEPPPFLERQAVLVLSINPASCQLQPSDSPRGSYITVEEFLDDYTRMDGHPILPPDHPLRTGSPD